MKWIRNRINKIYNEEKIVFWVVVFSIIFLPLYLIGANFINILLNNSSVVEMLGYLVVSSLALLVLLLSIGIVFLCMRNSYRKIGIYILQKIFETVVLTVVVSLMIGIVNEMIGQAFSEPSTNSPQTEEIENLKSRVEDLENQLEDGN